MLIGFACDAAGPKRPTETLEPAADAVHRNLRQRRLFPLGVLRGVIADRGPPLLQHRESHGTPEWRQELLRHLQIREPVCLNLQTAQWEIGRRIS